MGFSFGVNTLMASCQSGPLEEIARCFPFGIQNLFAVKKGTVPVSLQVVQNICQHHLLVLSLPAFITFRGLCEYQVQGHRNYIKNVGKLRCFYCCFLSLQIIVMVRLPVNAKNVIVSSAIWKS